MSSCRLNLSPRKESVKKSEEVVKHSMRERKTLGARETGIETEVSDFPLLLGLLERVQLYKDDVVRSI